MLWIRNKQRNYEKLEGKDWLEGEIEREVDLSIIKPIS